MIIRVTDRKKNILQWCLSFFHSEVIGQTLPGRNQSGDLRSRFHASKWSFKKKKKNLQAAKISDQKRHRRDVQATYIFPLVQVVRRKPL